MDSEKFALRLMYEEAFVRFQVGELDEHDKLFWNDRFLHAGYARAIDDLNIIREKAEEVAAADGIEVPIINIDNSLSMASRIFVEYKDEYFVRDWDALFQGKPYEISDSDREVLKGEYTRGYSQGLKAAVAPPNTLQAGLFTQLDILVSAVNKCYAETYNFMRQKMEAEFIDEDDIKNTSYAYGLTYTMEIMRGYITEHMARIVLENFPVTSSREELSEKLTSRFESIRSNFLNDMDESAPRYESDFQKARFQGHVQELKDNALKYTGLDLKDMSFAEIATGFIDAREWAEEILENFGEMPEEEWEAWTATKFPAKFPQPVETQQKLSLN